MQEIQAKNILLTGASSGIGAALARAYAQKGTQLFLSGRNEERLNAVAKDAREKGATVFVHVVDVTDAAAMNAWITEIDEAHRLDLVIANAGISAGTGGGEESPAQNAAIFATNVHGVFNTVQPIVPRMRARGCGQVAIMASLAGFRGLPGAASYVASKAAVRVYGEALRGELAAHGVKVNVICPGFVQTPLTSVNKFRMPFVMSAERAADVIKKGLAQNRSRIAFPWPLASIIWLIAALPPAWTDALLASLPRKE
ncbi:MAG: SDR family NAD(P)-dependent oxidoreductase [Alphaproteobacteria bacterium]|nr:SDR family NAD(P)-dependent oxidoreductase [Alphaproteobacteria bacterium]